MYIRFYHLSLFEYLKKGVENVTSSWSYNDIKEIHERRYLLKDIGIELFLCFGQTILLAFDDTKVSRVAAVFLANLFFFLCNFFYKGEKHCFEDDKKQAIDKFGENRSHY